MSFGTLITGDERRKLQSLETVVARGQKAFVEVGCALAEIRDSKLYRQDYKTFEDYCREKWGWKRQRAYELIDAAQVTKSLPEECNKFITNDSQAREIAKVEPEKRAEVLEIAAQSGPVTAKAIREAAESRQHRQEVGSVAPEPAPGPQPAVPCNRFAIEIEESCNAAVNEGSLDEMKAAKSACELGALKLKTAILELRSAGL